MQDKRKDSKVEDINVAKVKNITEHFVEFTKHVRPWLAELSESCKGGGYYPVVPMSIITSFYEDVRDKEIAAFACLYMREPYGGYERVTELRELMGEHPWTWFEQRMFAPIGRGEGFYCTTGGMRRYLLAKAFENLWIECSEHNETSVYDAIHGMMEREHLSYHDVLVELMGIDSSDYRESMRLFLVVLGTSDGIGCGAWTIADEDIRCPLSHRSRLFLRLWFPNYRTIGEDDVIKMLGFDRGSDFLYAYWGWKELQKRNPKECARFTRRYLIRYKSGILFHVSRWREMLPPINLGTKQQKG